MIARLSFMNLNLYSPSGGTAASKGGTETFMILKDASFARLALLTFLCCPLGFADFAAAGSINTFSTFSVDAGSSSVSAGSGFFLFGVVKIPSLVPSAGFVSLCSLLL